MPRRRPRPSRASASASRTSNCVAQARAGRQGHGRAASSSLRRAAVDDLDPSRARRSEYRADELGYLRAEVPVGKAESKSRRCRAVEGADVDRTIQARRPAPAGHPGPVRRSPRRARRRRGSTRTCRPVTPARPSSSTHNPKFDGRGVTVGIIDSGVDLGHPSLNTTSTGERKIVDWVTATDPASRTGVNSDNDPTWIDMCEPGARRSRRATASACSTSGTRGWAASWATTSTATATPRAASARSACCGTRPPAPSGSTRTRTRTSPTTRPMTDYKVEQDVGTLRHGQPGDAGHASRCRSSCRPSPVDELGQHRHRLR